ncbi:unnamed protein product [Rhodiola kirilowii]
MILLGVIKFCLSDTGRDDRSQKSASIEEDYSSVQNWLKRQIAGQITGHEYDSGDEQFATSVAATAYAVHSLVVANTSFRNGKTLTKEKSRKGVHQAQMPRTRTTEIAPGKCCGCEAGIGGTRPRGTTDEGVKLLEEFAKCAVRSESVTKKDVDNQGPTSETSMPCNDSPNSLPINEMEIPTETETGNGNPPIIVDAPKESPHSPVQVDPGLRQLICTFPVNEQDRIRREYLLMGPHQPKLNNYPQTFDGREKRRFQHRWFTLYPWLEYSEARDRAFCFPCFLFEKNPPRYPLFTVEGCCNWGRMLAGMNGICVQHIGKLNSTHQKNVQSWADLLRTSQHIDRVIDRLPPEIVRQNRLRLKTTIAAVKYLGKEGLPFRGHDESSNSSSRGHFIEIIKSYASMNDEIAKVVLENAPKHAMYIAPSIQKEILDIIATKIRNKIRQEIGDAKFCILVDESLDVSHKEQMAIILRFVDEDGFLQERYFEIVSVEDTTSANLKKHICEVLSTNKLQVQNIRGQGYDGASNMRGQFHGLKTLFLHDCPYAYYVHCFAHRLQLALNACARDVPDMQLFFQMLSSIVAFVSSLSKRTNLLKDIQEAEIAESLADGDLETGKGLNQIRSLKRAGTTRWGSHFASVTTLVHVFKEVTQLLQSMMTDKELTGSIRGDAKGFLKALRAFEFVFCLLLTNKVMGITDLLSQALQKQSQDIVDLVP